MLHKIVDYIKEEEFRITIFNDRIHILNYEEVLSLEEDRVSIRTQKGRMVIKGTKMSVNKLMEKEILLLGKVSSIEMSTSNE